MCQAQSVSSSRHYLQSEAHTGYWNPTNIILFTLFTNTLIVTAVKFGELPTLLPYVIEIKLLQKRVIRLISGVSRQCHTNILFSR